MTRFSCHFLSFPTRRTSEDLPPPTHTTLTKPFVEKVCKTNFLSCVGGVRTSPVLLVVTLYPWYSVLTTPFFCKTKKRLHSQGIKGLLPFPLTHNRGTFSPAKIIGRRAEEASSSPLLPRFFPPTKGTDFPFGNLFRPCDF